MKIIIVETEIDGMHDNIVNTFEITDNATDEEIEEKAKELAFDKISWSYREATEKEIEELQDV